MKFANPLKKNRVIASIMGHSIEFPGRVAPNKEQPEGLTFVQVPDLLIPECIAAGLATEDDLPEQEEGAKPTRPMNPEEVKSQMFDAFDLLVKANDRNSFTAAGSPKNAAVEALVGWEVDNATLKDQWKAYQLAAAEGSK